MNLPSKLHRGLLILGVAIGILTLSDDKAYAGHTRIRGRIYTPVGDVYIESGHRHHRRHYYHRHYRHRHHYYHHHRYYRHRH